MSISFPFIPRQKSPSAMSRLVAAGLISCLAFSAPMVAFSAPTQELAPIKAITTEGEGEVKVKLDTVHVSVAIQHQAKTKTEAMNLVNQNAQQVIRALKGLGYSQLQLNTDSVSVNPIYSQPDPHGGVNQLAKVIGYQAYNNLEVVVEKLSPSELTTTGSRLIDTALTNGATNLNSFYTSVSDLVPYKKQALAKAIADAKANAEVMAQAAGVRVVGVQSISGNPSYSSPPILMGRQQVFKADAMAESMAPTPIEVKDTSISSRVSVIFIFE